MVDANRGHFGRSQPSRSWKTTRELGAAIAVLLAMLGASLATAQDDLMHPLGADSAVEGEDLQPIESLDLEWLLSTPIVQAVTKRAQAFFDAPAEIVVVNSEEIAIRSADSIAELFRQVPGAWVAQTDAQVFNVGLRGLNQVSNNHVLTLLDGRNLAAPTMGYTPWALVPLHPAEVERIEVVYGPGTTMYGANAFSGVINITSRRPLDHQGLDLAFSGGGYARQEEADDAYWLNTGSTGYGAYGWANEERTLGLRLSLGYSSRPEWSDLPEATKLPTEEQEDGSLSPRRGLFSYYARLMLQYADEGTELLAYVSHAHTEHYALIVTMLDTEPAEEMEQTFGIRLENTGWLGEDLTLSLGVDGSRTDSFLPTTEGWQNYNVHGFAQIDVRLWNDRESFSVGTEVSHLVGQGFLDRDPASTYVAAYLQNELAILEIPKLLLDLGARWEQVSTNDGRGNEIVYRNLNPSAALVLNVEDAHSVWLSGATAYRTPTTLENVSVFEQNRDSELPSAILANNLQLRPTEVISVELGYRMALRERYQLSLVAFRQWVDDIIIPAPVPDIPLQFVNGQDVVQTGGTVRGSMAISEAVRADAWYTYTHTDTTRGVERGEWPEHLAGLTLDANLPYHLRLTTDIKVVSETFSTHVRMDAESLGVDTIESGPLALWNLRLGYGFGEGMGEVFLAGRHLVGLFLNPQDLHQFPVSSAQPIGGSVIIGVQLLDL